jgi:ferric iron reductase protein FhuF
LAGFAKTLVLDEARRVVPLGELLRDETLDRLLLQVYGPELMPGQRPVLVSQWMKYYAMQLIPPVMAAGLMHRAGWPLAVGQLSFAVHERGFLDGVRFDGAPFEASNSDDPFERFAPLMDNLQQVIARLSAYGGVAPGVLWGTAGDYLESCLRQLTRIDLAAGAVGNGLLREKTRPDGRRNPLFNAITYIEGKDGQSVRQRRSCCLSHRVEWVGRCEHCPLHRGVGPRE